MEESKFREMEAIFHPRSVAVVGATSDQSKFGYRFLKSLVDVGFGGPVYPVNPSYQEVLGLKAYPKVSDAPGPVDYVIVAVPARFVLEVLEDCARKGVKAVHFFTAGFRETGEKAGLLLEQEMVSIARRGGFRIIGPNCIGICNPSHRVPYGVVGEMGLQGSVAFLSQSGGHGSRMVETGKRRGLGLSKVASFGNGCDLDALDFLGYFAKDPHTQVIGAYLEGISDGGRFLRLAQEVCRSKPLVVWKGGKTPEGAQAAYSHTGSLASNDALWRAGLRQAGAVKAETFGELADTLLAFQCLPPFTGRRVGLVSGLTGGGGGDSVSSTDACAEAGLQVLPFAESTRARLRELTPPAGTILRNPLDIGGVGGNPDTLRQVLDAVAADPSVELVVVNLRLADLIHATPRPTLEALLEVFRGFRREKVRPLAVVSPLLREEPAQPAVERELVAAGVPVFASVEGMARALVNAAWYWANRK